MINLDLNSYGLTEESKNRLAEIITKMNEEDQDFYNCLSFEEDDQISDRGLRYALYTLTDNDQLIETGHYKESINFPYWLDERGHNSELKKWLYDLSLEVSILSSYYSHKFENYIVIDDIFQDGEWELESSDVLYTIFDFMDHNYADAEKLAEDLNLRDWYYADTLQINYLINIDSIEELINNDETSYNNRHRIIELIEELTNYDQVALSRLKEKLELIA